MLHRRTFWQKCPPYLFDAPCASFCSHKSVKLLPKGKICIFTRKLNLLEALAVDCNVQQSKIYNVISLSGNGRRRGTSGAFNLNDKS